jgi:sigma-B regulation protein RsbU (phosphoserine phosphatase)
LDPRIGYPAAHRHCRCLSKHHFAKAACRPLEAYTCPTRTAAHVPGDPHSTVDQRGNAVTVTELAIPDEATDLATPHDEPARLSAVRRYDILDTPAEGSFDRIAALAARCLDAPIGMVTIVDHDRIWCKARYGLEVTELDRASGFCASAIFQADPYVVLDASVDPRFLTNRLVAEEFGLRFYAAAPIVTHDGYRLGTVNVMDKNPREITQQQMETLQDLAAIVVDELELRLSARRLQEMQSELAQLGEAFQLSALPPRLPAIAGLDLAAWYRPAAPGLLIGGDFYETIDLGRGTWALVLGDVCGHGTDAAVVMGAVIRQIKALAEVDRLPSRLLHDLNESLVKEEPPEKLCTVCYMLLQPGAGYLDLTVCCAGHPLPVVRRADGTLEAACAEGTMLGAFHDPYLTDSRIRLEAGDALLAYTDGVTEQNRNAKQGERNLRNAFSNCSQTSAKEILSYIEDETQPETEAHDDRAMVLIKVTN